MLPLIRDLPRASRNGPAKDRENVASYEDAYTMCSGRDDRVGGDITSVDILLKSEVEELVD